MDPVTIITAIITVAGAVCKSYEQISKFVTNVQNAPKVLEGVRSRVGTIQSLVMNLKLALEETVIRRVIERDVLAFKHVEALSEPLCAVEGTLDEVVVNLTRQYKSTGDRKGYKVRWRYYLAISDWDELQARLSFHIQVLSASMQGLHTCVYTRSHLLKHC